MILEIYSFEPPKSVFAISIVTRTRAICMSKLNEEKTTSHALVDSDDVQSKVDVVLIGDVENANFPA